MEIENQEKKMDRIFNGYMFVTMLDPNEEESNNHHNPIESNYVLLMSYDKLSKRHYSSLRRLQNLDKEIYQFKEEIDIAS